jgi:flagellar basal body-associated protein FliL
MKNMNMKNKILIIIISLIALILVATGVVIGLGYINKPAQQANNTDSTSTQEQAKDKETLAQEATKSGDYDKAKQLLQEAIDQYKSISDKNAEINASAQLYLLENIEEPAITNPNQSQSGN